MQGYDLGLKELDESNTLSSPSSVVLNNKVTYGKASFSIGYLRLPFLCLTATNGAAAPQHCRYAQLHSR